MMTEYVAFQYADSYEEVANLFLAIDRCTDIDKLNSSADKDVSLD